MHSPSARALRHLDRYCIVLVRTLKHVSPAKCVITITNVWYNYTIHAGMYRVHYSSGGALDLSCSMN